MLDIEQIKEIIPHRHPFLLIDYIEDFEPGKYAVGYKCVSYREEFFKGHFPQEPVMPGVLIMEAMAQTTAVLLMNREEMRGKIGYYGAMNKVRFRKKVVPGTVLRMEIEILKRKGPVAVAMGKAYTDEGLAAEGEMTFMIG